MTTKISIALLVMAMAGSAGAAPRAPIPDVQAMAHLHYLNQEQLAAARLARERGASPQVQQYANEVIQHHRAADQQIRIWADQRGMPIPPDRPRTADAQQERLEAQRDLTYLQTLRGPEFDRELVKFLAARQGRALTWIDQQTPAANDPQLRDALARMRPMMTAQRDQALALSRTLGAPETGAGGMVGQCPHCHAGPGAG